jgi:hypothetical protein
VAILGLLAGDARGLDLAAAACLDQIVPVFVATQDLDHSFAAVIGARTVRFLRLFFLFVRRLLLVGRLEHVEQRMPWQRDHLFGNVAGVVEAAQLHQRAHEPFVVVGVELDLVGQNVIALDPCVFRAEAGLELPGCFRIAAQRVIDVGRHVPHVADPRGRFARLGRRRQTLSLVIPLVDEVDDGMMDRVQRVDGQNLVGKCQRFGRLVPLRRPRLEAMPDPPDGEGLGFQVVGKLLDQRLVARIVAQGVDIHLLAGRKPGLVSGCLCRKLPGAGRVARVRQRHAPMSDAAIRIERGRLPERTLGLVIREAVKLPDPLFDVFLDAGILRRHGKMNLPRTGDQPCTLSGAAVKDFTGVRVSGEK